MNVRLPPLKRELIIRDACCNVSLRRSWCVIGPALGDYVLCIVSLRVGWPKFRLASEFARPRPDVCQSGTMDFFWCNFLYKHTCRNYCVTRHILTVYFCPSQPGFHTGTKFTKEIHFSGWNTSLSILDHDALFDIIVTVNPGSLGTLNN